MDVEVRQIDQVKVGAFNYRQAMNYLIIWFDRERDCLRKGNFVQEK